MGINQAQEPAQTQEGTEKPDSWKLNDYLFKPFLVHEYKINLMFSFVSLNVLGIRKNFRSYMSLI